MQRGKRPRERERESNRYSDGDKERETRVRDVLVAVNACKLIQLQFRLIA